MSCLSKIPRQCARLAAFLLFVIAIVQVSANATAVDQTSWLYSYFDTTDPYLDAVSAAAANPSNANSILLKGGTIIAYDDKKKDLDIIRGGDILIVNDRIQQIGKSISAPFDAQVVDVTGSIISPGFIDTHRHGWQHVMQTLAPDIGLGEYLYKYAGSGKWTPNLSAQDVYVSTRMALAASLDGGVTSLLDQGHALFTPDHGTNILKAEIESGARVWHAHSPGPIVSSTKYEFDWSGMENKDSWQWQQLRKFAEEAPWADGRVQLALAWDFGRSNEEAKFGFQLAQDLNLTAVTMHYVGYLVKTGGYTSKAIYQLAQWGFLNSTYPVIFSHGSSVDGSELAILQRYNHFISITPESEHHYAHGQLFTSGFMAQSALGTDTPFTYSSDIVTQMRLQLQSTRQTLARTAQYNSHFVNNTAMTVNQIFLLGTRNGGLAMRRPDLGVIKVGAKADLVVFSSDNPAFSSFYDPVAAVVLHSSIRDIQHVLVDGRWVKRDFKLVGVNWPKLKGDFGESSRRIQKILVEMAKDWAPVRADWFKMTGSTEDMYEPVGKVGVDPSVM